MDIGKELKDEIKSFIAKANDDLRQESLTMQLIKCFSDIFKKADIKDE